MTRVLDSVRPAIPPVDFPSVGVRCGWALQRSSKGRASSLPSLRRMCKLLRRSNLRVLSRDNSEGRPASVIIACTGPGNTMPPAWAEMQPCKAANVAMRGRTRRSRSSRRGEASIEGPGRSVPQSRPVENRRIERPVGDAEHAREALVPSRDCRPGSTAAALPSMAAIVGMRAARVAECRNDRPGQVRSWTHKNMPNFCAAAPINSASLCPLHAFKATPE